MKKSIGKDDVREDDGDYEFRLANPIPKWVGRNHISEESVKREFSQVKVPNYMKKEGYRPSAGALALDERLFVYLANDLAGNWHYMDVDGTVENEPYGKLPDDSFIVRL